MSIKRIMIISTLIAVPMVIVFGGVHYVTFVKKQQAIDAMMAQTNDPYYKGLASVCYKKNYTQYACCLASVAKMMVIDAAQSKDGICVSGRADRLSCDGSYVWCVPSEDNDVKKACTKDSDCVPSTCCHATETVNEKFAPECGDVLCTMSCETILDCGRGAPVCEDGVCGIRSIDQPL